MKPEKIRRSRRSTALAALLLSQCLIFCLGPDDKRAGTSTVTENRFGAEPKPITRLEGIIRLSTGEPASGTIVTVRTGALVPKPDGTVEPMLIGMDTADADGKFRILFRGFAGTFYLEMKRAKGEGTFSEAFFKKFQVLPGGEAYGPTDSTVTSQHPADIVEPFRLSRTGSLTFRLKPKSLPPLERFWIGMNGCRAFTASVAPSDTAVESAFHLDELPAGEHGLMLARLDSLGGIAWPDTLAVVEIKAGENHDRGLIRY